VREFALDGDHLTVEVRVERDGFARGPLVHVLRAVTDVA
jgi:hypothetical protein